MTRFTDDQYRETALRLIQESDDVLVDREADVAPGEDEGAWVQVWHWVSDYDVIGVLCIEEDDDDQ
jgi:hypothetical protein